MKKKLLLLMCILTFACSACSSADAGNTEETVEANPEEVQAELEDISINADVSQTYDINTEVPVEISTTPEDLLFLPLPSLFQVGKYLKMKVLLYLLLPRKEHLPFTRNLVR